MKLHALFPAVLLSLLLHFVAFSSANGQGLKSAYAGWAHSGTLTLLTTPEGANLPASAAVEQFPVLVRLKKDWFEFSQAKAGGEDVRFALESGEPLAYEIEHWDAASGSASIWVRLPRIAGNSLQTIRIFWGKANATSESNAKAVFNVSNGYLSVFHLSGEVKDSTGKLSPKDVGTTGTAGLIGEARHFGGKQGIAGGEEITGYPAGTEPSTTEAWVRAEKPNSTIIGWGMQKGQSKFVISVRSPAQLLVDSFFGAGVEGTTRVPLNEWIHMVHTYRQGESMLYLNGVPYATGPKSGPMAFPTPLKLWIGGWYNNYDFLGDIDEVRVCKVTRSADWVRLEYENQQALNSLVGPLVQAGNSFAVTPEMSVVEEGKSLALSAQAGGACKIYWVLKRDGREEVVAADCFHFTFAAGRVASDTTAVLQFKAVYPNGVKTRDIALTIKKTIPEPVFTLSAPTAWDGRQTIEVVPKITNLAAMKEKGAGTLKVEWSVGPMAVIKEASPEKLILKRSQNSGKLTVSAKISTGGSVITQSCSITVREPQHDAWVDRVAAKEEKPEEGQFYARDGKDEGTLIYNGTLGKPADSVFLKLYANDKLIKTATAKPAADKSYALAVKLKPGLIKYRVEFGTVGGGKENILEKVGDLVCGDAYLIEGQSNALATDTREESEPVTNEWIRSYGVPPPKPNGNAGNLWCRPVWKARKGEKAELGWWGMELAKRLLESQKVPVFV
ncbi:MAG: DUF2341 domain-containing protein, partial [Chthoniobacterales bacterium]|nr:DUF2341 domain-containing protein [Chthoniobacterales bacterium]